jgi:bifunctional pyridoxal-dependent enzyme with beta-cystathionase and maltose regulon repressor activities
MKTYLISYDLGIPETSSDYEKIITYIKSLGNWAKPLKSQWFVVSGKNCSEIRTALRELTDTNDKILVMEVTGDDWATARMSDELTTWMKNNI